MWSFRDFEMVVSSTDRQQTRRHSAEIVKLLVPQGKNEAFRSRLGYNSFCSSCVGTFFQRMMFETHMKYM